MGNSLFHSQKISRVARHFFLKQTFGKDNLIQHNLVESLSHCENSVVLETDCSSKSCLFENEATILSLMEPNDLTVSAAKMNTTLYCRDSKYPAL